MEDPPGRRLPERPRLEPGRGLDEGERHGADGAVAVLGDAQVDEAGDLVVVVGAGAVQQQDDVAFLLDGAGLAQIRQQRRRSPRASTRG